MVCGAVGSVSWEKSVYAGLFIIESRSHECLSHSPRKWDIIIMLVTSSFSSATTYYPTYLLSQFHRLSLKAAAAVQDVRKDLMSLLCNFIFVSCLLVWDTDFITKVNLTNGFPVNRAFVSITLSEMAFMLYFTQHKDFFVKFFKLG